MQSHPEPGLSYVICGEPSAVTEAAATLCRLFGLTDIAGHQAEQADVVLLDHSSWRHPIAARDLEFYRSSLGGSKKTILRFVNEEAGSRSNGSKWLFEVCAWSPQMTDVLQSLLYARESRKGASLPVAVDLETCRNLLEGALKLGHSGGLADLQTLLSRWTSEVKPEHLVGAMTTPDLYDLLLRLSAEKDACDHDFGKVFAHPFRYQVSLEGAIEAARVRNVCEDLRLSLLNRLAAPPAGEPAGVLLIDDKPEDLTADLKLLQPLLPEGFELILWNPMANESDRNVFERLCAYRSVDHSRLSGSEVRIQRVIDPGGEKISTELVHLLGELQFIVVDQLFREPGGHTELRGHELIRGLARLLRDKEEKNRLPQIVALSHTSSPLVINRALRAGARDYVEKSRLNALPGVLARVQRTISNPAWGLHRNFSLLNKLPNEVIGLLRTAQIPWDELGLSIPDDDATRIAHTILSAVPKTDLHLHVGSCMSSEFLVVASLIGLLQWEQLEENHWLAIGALAQAVSADRASFDLDLPGVEPAAVEFRGGLEWFSSFAAGILDWLRSLLTTFYSERDLPKGSQRYKALRSVLHAELAISDYISAETADEALATRIADLDIAWFGIRHLVRCRASPRLDNDTLVRLYLVVLAARTPDSRLEIGEEPVDLLPWFRLDREATDFPFEAWTNLRKQFHVKGGVYATKELRENGWRLKEHQPLPKIRLSLSQILIESPIEHTVGTGTRSHSLQEYLHGCKFSGKTHLRHPFLVHLYAQHLIATLVDQGLMYVELRASPDGYVSHDFGFADACACMVTALSSAQEAVVQAYLRQNSNPAWSPEEPWLPDILGDLEQWGFSALKRTLSAAPISSRRLPVKVSLILVGKRHKSKTDMMLEAAAGSMLYQIDGRFQTLAASRILDECRSCRVVGFDLAGNEADFPPGLFASEFQRLARHKLPITVHAGENASSRFVEDAIVDLGAKRIGHGLSLADDERLMALVREQRICIELCPVSNHQTSQFTPEGEPGRSYPLRKFLSRGISVCINTDNPIISRTDIVKEYFMASSAAGGLSLWDALRLVKTGFCNAFLSLPVRRAMLEVVDQTLFDLFSDPAVQADLRELVTLREGEPHDRDGGDPGTDPTSGAYEYSTLEARREKAEGHQRWRLR